MKYEISGTLNSESFARNIYVKFSLKINVSLKRGASLTQRLWVVPYSNISLLNSPLFIATSISVKLCNQLRAQHF